MDAVVQLEVILSQLGTIDKILLTAPSPCQALATICNCEQRTDFMVLVDLFHELISQSVGDNDSNSPE